jgi:DNA-binding response OmpR family regulator
VATLLVVTSADDPVTPLPALGLLEHELDPCPPQPGALLEAAPAADIVLLDARTDLAAARSFARLLLASEVSAPRIAVLTEGGLAVVTAEWGLADVLLVTAGPAEVAARLRLVLGRQRAAREQAQTGVTTAGELVIDEHTYAARLRGRPLDLTFKEFELLKHLAAHPGRVFTRAQLLQEVWGYDYYGGTRTVDVHVRRLRAKLGPEFEGLIGTVRNVGYKFVPHGAGRPAGDESGTTLESGRALEPGRGLEPGRMLESGTALES